MFKERKNASARAFPAARASGCLPSSADESLRDRLLCSSGGWVALGDSILRNRPLLSGFGALLIALAPTTAFAQTPTQQTATQPDQPIAVRDRSHPEYDPLGMRFGAFKLNGSLDLEAAGTDNVFAASSSTAQDDFIYAAAPTLRLSSDWSRNALVIDAGGRFTRYRDHSTEDADTGYIRGAGRLDVGTSTSISASARFAHQVTPRTDPDNPLIGGPVEYDRTDGSIGIQQRFVRFTVTGDLSASDYSYDTLSARDNTQTVAHGRVTFDLSPRIGLLADATLDSRDYDNSPTVSSDGQVYLAGVTMNGDLFRGELSAGYFRREFKGLPTFDGLAVSGNLSWFVTELTTVTFDAHRDANAEIGLTSGFPYITTELGIQVDHELLRNVIISAEYRRGKRDYDTIDRNDDYSRISVGADYVLNRHAAIRVRFDHFDDNSSGTMAYHDYKMNTGTVGLSLRL